MQITSLGSSQEIGASCHYLSLDGVGLFLDSGADPNAEGLPSLPRYGFVDQLHGSDRPQHVFITHAHHDHIGGLPSLVEAFPDVDIHMTAATRQLVDSMLLASARLQERKLREGSTHHPPLFDAEMVEEIRDLYDWHRYEQPFPLYALPETCKATFYDAGHVLGSAGVLIEWNDGGRHRRLFYTSDTNTQDQTIIPGGRYPSPPLDVLVMETTLGADAQAELTTREREEERFGEALKEVLARGGCALVPVFMLGRSQEVLAVINRLKREGTVPAATPVYTAGGMREVARIYDHTRGDTPRLDPSFKVSKVQQRYLPYKQAKLMRTLRQPSIFVVSSGMLFEKTMSNRLAQHMVEHSRHAILMVGYCKDDSPGGRLLEALRSGADSVMLDREVGIQPLECQVERFRFSGHCHRRHLVDLAGRLRPKKAVLVHGDVEARAWMAQAINAAHPDIELILPEMGQPVTL